MTSRFRLSILVWAALGLACANATTPDSNGGTGSSGASTSASSSNATSGSSGASRSSSTGPSSSSQVGGSSSSASSGGGSGQDASGPVTAAIQDDFEGSSLSSKWSIHGQDGMGVTSTTAVLDKQHAHSGVQAVHITDGYIEIAPPAPAFYIRVWAYFGADPGTNHWANVIAADSTDTNEVRYGGHDGILEINRKTNDDEILADPLISYCATTPCPASDPRMPIGKWTCLQYYFGVNQLGMWVDGTEVPEFAVTGTTAWAHGTMFTSPTYAFTGIGYAMYGSTAIDVWYDDVAIDMNMVPCN